MKCLTIAVEAYRFLKAKTILSQERPLPSRTAYMSPVSSRLLVPLLFLLIGSSTAISQTAPQIRLTPYGVYLTYDETLAKEHSLITGLYSSFGKGAHHALETDFSYTRINYGEVVDTVGARRLIRTPINIDQFDVTLAYTNSLLTNLKLRVGGHAIFSGEEPGTQDYVLFGGIQRYRPYSYTAGIDMYASFYDAFNPDLTVLQSTGTFGFYFGNYYTYGSFYAQTRGSYIRLSEDIGFTDKEFASIEQSLFFIRDKLTIHAFIWTGYQVLAVQKEGFVVFNLAERHLGAYGGSFKYRFRKHSAMTLALARGKFKEIGSDAIAGSQNLTLILEFTF